MKYQVEPSHENMTFSHMNRSLLLCLQNKLHLIWVYTKIEHYKATWRYKISLLVLKKYFISESSKGVKYFSTREEKFMCSGAYKHLGLKQEGRRGGNWHLQAPQLSKVKGYFTLLFFVDVKIINDQVWNLQLVSNYVTL